MCCCSPLFAAHTINNCFSCWLSIVSTINKNSHCVIGGGFNEAARAFKLEMPAADTTPWLTDNAEKVARSGWFLFCFGTYVRGRRRARDYIILMCAVILDEAEPAKFNKMKLFAFDTGRRKSGSECHSLVKRKLWDARWRKLGYPQNNREIMVSKFWFALSSAQRSNIYSI